VARDSKTKRRRKKTRRARNRLWEAYRHAWSKVSAPPFRRRYFHGFRFGHNSLLIDFDYSTPVPARALDPERPSESLEETHRAVLAAERDTRSRGEA